MSDATGSPPPPDISPSSLIKAISLVGPSDSGKTQLICALLGFLESRGLRVAVLKHSGSLKFGDEGKDTWRFRQAGAKLVALAASGVLQITRYPEADPPLPQILAALAPEADLILVEGYKSGPLPKLVVAGPEPRPPASPYPDAIALISSAPQAGPLPQFHPGQVAEIGEFILRYLGL